MINGIPRFRGRAFKKKDKWSWEFHLSMLGKEEGNVFGTELLFNTKKEAVKDLNSAIQKAIQILAKELPNMGINADIYIDVKTNTTRRWDKKDEH